MAEPTAARVALMSIKPEYAEKLLSGLKRVEFRRSGPKARVERILVYATQPVGALVGILEVVATERATPQKLWRRYGAVGGIDRSAFFAYFDGTEAGDALLVGRVWRLETPVSLEEAGLAPKAPQSFRYVESAFVSQLEAHCDTW